MGTQNTWEISTLTRLPPQLPYASLGDPLPPEEKHAVSVYIPTWEDTVAWARRDPSLLPKLRTGYPRFFIPLNVRELGKRLLQWVVSKEEFSSLCSEFWGPSGELTWDALVFPSAESAMKCKRYLETPTGPATVVFLITFAGGVLFLESVTPKVRHDDLHKSVFVVVYSPQLESQAKAFWQHTGFGISSRCADFWLKKSSFFCYSRNQGEDTTDLPIEDSKYAKTVLRKRIARLLSSPENTVQMDAVYLYPTGMSAISHTVAAIPTLQDQHSCRVVVFGFLYVDTLKVLQKIYHVDPVLFGRGTVDDLHNLERDLNDGLHIDALYTEFPGNPLLGSVDLHKLYQLAKRHRFILVVDDTVGTSVNVSLLANCDMICTSLTKMFSGSCNVMGGSIAINPRSRQFETLKQSISDQYIDTYFPLDILTMEKNSVDFEARVLNASTNAERLSERLRRHPAVAKVFYPKGSSTEHTYNRYKQPGRGYGYLLSIEFVKPEAAIAFHDSLDLAKGPSLGTNFTLCCAYTLFAHYSELEWAAQYGVKEHLVRISVGVERWQHLEELIDVALNAAVGQI